MISSWDQTHSSLIPAQTEAACCSILASVHFHEQGVVFLPRLFNDGGFLDVMYGSSTNVDPKFPLMHKSFHGACECRPGSDTYTSTKCLIFSSKSCSSALFHQSS